MKTTSPHSRLSPTSVVSALALTLTLAGSVMTGCGQEGQPAASEEGTSVMAVSPNGSYLILRSHVRLMPAELAQAASFTPETIVLPDAYASQASAWTAGTILVAQRDTGYWRHVERTERRDGQLIIHTRDAEFLELIEEGDLLIEMGASDDIGQHRAALEQEYIEDAGGGGGRVYTPNPSPPSAGDDTTVIDLENLSGTRGPRYSYDLASTHAGEVSTAGYTVEVTQGQLDVDVTFISRMKIAAGQIVEEETSALAHVDTDPQWLITSTGDHADRHVFRLHSAHGSQPLFSFLQRSFYFTGDLTVAYDVRTEGDAELTAGFVAEGHAFAGVYCTQQTGGTQNCRAMQREPRFQGVHAEERGYQTRGEGAISFDALFGVSAALVDTPNAATASPITSLEPLRVNYRSTMTMRPPYCPRYGRLTVNAGASKPAVSSPIRYTSESRRLFEHNEIVSDAPGCSINEGDEPLYCERNADCEGDMICFRGICDVAAPMRLVADWSANADLNLFVELPSQEILSVANRRGAGGSITLVSNGGGECEDCGMCIGDLRVDCAAEEPTDGQCPQGCSLASNGQSCTGGVVRCGVFGKDACAQADTCQWSPLGGGLPPYLEIATVDHPVIDGVYRVWVENTSGRYNGSPEPVQYEISIYGQNEQSAALTGHVSGVAGSRSLTTLYRYGVIEQNEECIPVYDSQLCEEAGNACGEFSAVDNCGVTRESVHCGACDVGVPCQNNQCVCTEQTDAQICASRGYQCGTREVIDSCNNTRTIDCGGCSEGVTCSDQNICCGGGDSNPAQEICNEPEDFERTGCNSSSCEEPPADLGCGLVRRRDSCGEMQETDCGGCAMYDGWYFAGTDENDVLQDCGNRSVCSYHLYEYREYSCTSEKCRYNVTNHETRLVGCEACPDPFIGPWTSCDDFDGTCDQTGSRTRNHYDFDCSLPPNTSMTAYVNSLTANAINPDLDLANYPVAVCEGEVVQVEPGVCSRNTQGATCPGGGMCVFGECLQNECNIVNMECSGNNDQRCRSVSVASASRLTCIDEDECYIDDDCNVGNSSQDPERVCSVSGDSNPQRVCVEPNSGGAAVGQSCSTHSQCEQNHCRNGVCTIPCRSQYDCSSYGMNCEAEVYGNEAFNICVPNG
ncbi:hypothetical protein FRC98_16340 [Lujinxingia vulgaris]|uniref:Uncharacterized protein n=1 Tax=Lujinxingia vulgaris TaxID=2600176 RepID=A0A5C6XE39_9DELT|nr:hypothetical protein [Lujinxingia vulgaris]TXD35384.1 hypothetical protein FRC98_16340 [Lujinxingia vulgaris]